MAAQKEEEGSRSLSSNCFLQKHVMLFHRMRRSNVSGFYDSHFEVQGIACIADLWICDKVEESNMLWLSWLAIFFTVTLLYFK